MQKDIKYIIMIVGLIALFGLVPSNVEGSSLDQLHEDIENLRQDIQQQKCQEQTGNITGCAIDRLNQDAADYFDKLINLD